MFTCFFTVDHQHLLSVMRDRFGIRGPAYNWFASYISGRSQTVTVMSQCSLPVSLVCGVPQGSALGPVKFIMYTEDLVSVINDVPPIIAHFYADDTQLLMSSSLGGTAAVCRALEQCVHDVQVWCFSHRRQLNPTKTELIWFGSELNVDRIATADVSVRVEAPSFSRATGSVTLALFLTVPCLCGITSPRSRRLVSFIFDGSERSDTYLTRTVDVVLYVRSS